MSQGTLFIVSAPSGAGKSSLINALLNKFNLDDRLRLSISHTTRAPRPNEVDHEDYHFVTIDEFKELIARDAFFEYAQVFDNYYGTSKEIVMEWLNEGKDVLFDIDWQGARLIKEQVPEAIKIFIMPPSINELHERLVKRGQDSVEVINKRMAQAVSEISHYDEYDYIIVNDDFDESLLALRGIILGERCRRDMVLKNHHDLFGSLKQQAEDFEKAWLPCSSALHAALAQAQTQAHTAPEADPKDVSEAAP